MKKVALILSGCGVYDGSEIHEVCAALLAMNQAGFEVQASAPSGPQMHVINHLAGEPADGESRDILTESARLMRGEIIPLNELNPTDFDAVVLPGGFGAAKNLCTFATEGDQCTVHSEVETFLRSAHSAGIPLGAMCIGPVILARVFGNELNPQVTIGNDLATADLVTKMGARHIDCQPTGTVVDKANKMVTTPAYMLAGTITEVFSGAKNFVDELSKLMD
ncbi:MAG: isoprenoid biosynthesis glyoxalase ElbB [bacterium]|nr:isoprenoid biosynthesis glyoxalase ElbB [bacterium]